MLLVLGAWWSRNPLPASVRPVVEGPRVEVHAAAPGEDCAASLVRLREQAGDRADVDLGALDAELRLASGQSSRVAGMPLGPPEAGEHDAEAVEAGARSAVDREVARRPDIPLRLVEVDCEEYPCILHLEGPAAGGPLHSGPFAVAIDLARPPRSERVFQRIAAHGGRLHAFAAWTDADRAEPVDEVEARVRFRVARGLADGDVPELVPPRGPSAPVHPHPCGPEHERLRAILAGDDERLREAIAWHWAVLALVEGASPPFPPDLPDRFREPAAWRTGEALAERLDLGLTDVDCSEYPCVLSLSATLASGTSLTDVHDRVLEAVRSLDGMAPEEVQYEVTTVHASAAPDVYLRVFLRPAGAALDLERLDRRRDPDPELSEAPSRLDWSQPLE
ncbi:MAG: hypothetical protein R3F61_13350 [Myxococcota bacterium]